MTRLQQVVETMQASQLKSQLPTIQVGDLVRVGVAIQEGNKQRTQLFEGVVIAQHKAGMNTTITLRKTLQGVGVERVFPIHAPCITSLQVLRRAHVARAKLYYLRDRVGKATRLKEKFATLPETWTQEKSV